MKVVIRHEKFIVGEYISEAVEFMCDLASGTTHDQDMKNHPIVSKRLDNHLLALWCFENADADYFGVLLWNVFGRLDKSSLSYNPFQVGCNQVCVKFFCSRPLNYWLKFALLQTSGPTDQLAQWICVLCICINWNEDEGFMTF